MDDFDLNPRSFTDAEPNMYPRFFYKGMLQSGLSRMNLLFYSGSMALMIFAGLQYSSDIDFGCSIFCSAIPVFIALVVKLVVS